MNPTSSVDEIRDVSPTILGVLDEWENVSNASDVSWTESAGEESDCDDEKLENVWRAVDNDFNNNDMSFNVIDHFKEGRYFTEARKVALNFLKKFKAVSLTTDDESEFDENQVLNTLFPTQILVSVIQFMNRILIERRSKPMLFPEFEPYLRSFFWLCFYRCGVADIQTHPNAYPLTVAEINKLEGNSFDERVDRLNDPLRSFNGHEVRPEKSSNHDTLHFQEVYGRDYGLE